MSKKKRPEDMNLKELIEAVKAKDPDALAYYKEVAEVVGSALDQLKPSFEQMQAFYKEHKAAYDALSDEEQALDLVKSLSLKDLQKIVEDDAAAKAWAYIEKAKKASEIDATELYFAALDCIEISDFIALYELKNNRFYRTRAKAREAGAITEAPKSLIVPTFNGYQYSMSLYQSGGAYLQPLSSMDGLCFKGGKLYFDDARMKEVGEAELKDLRTKEGIQDLDLTTLRYYYSILFDQFQRSGYKVLQDFIVVSVPLLAGRNNPKQAEIDAVIAKVQSYHNVMGVIKGKTPTGKPAESYYQVLNFEYYDKKHNIIAFSSPYMNYVIKTIYRLAVRTDKKGKPELKNNGEPLTKPINTYMIDESIRKERNKAAVENVIILVTVIEKGYRFLPNLKASTLIERNVQLAKRLEKDPQHGAQLLKRVFTKTWELMKTKTKLVERYKNLRVSVNKNSDGVLLAELNPNDPAFIPTVKSLEDLCFYFPNEGKENKEDEEDEE